MRGPELPSATGRPGCPAISDYPFAHWEKNNWSCTRFKKPESFKLYEQIILYAEKVEENYK